MSNTKLSQSKRRMYWIGGLLVVVFIIPNTTNFKERRAFSDERRIEMAKQYFNVEDVEDSVEVVAGSYYQRGKFSTLFLGEKQRELWNTPVKVPVFNYRKVKGGLKPFEFGGGQQTISIKLEDSQERKWSLRSVNKDQKHVLPGVLRITFLRFLTRDQLAAANPYGHLVLPDLSEAIGIHYTNPQLFFVPYDKEQGEYNERMAGRLAYLEENLNSSWKNRERFGSPKDIVNTDEMMEMQQEKTIAIDTMLYLKSRLFDILICDWDRHEGNWEWALTRDGDKTIFEPIPKDRDNAFFQFNEGLLSHMVLLFAPKFQSFRKEYKNVSGLAKQSRELDKRILSKSQREDFTLTAQQIQQSLTGDVIERAFKNYPPDVYKITGEKHQDILKARLEKLPDVALEFFELVNDD